MLSLFAALAAAAGSPAPAAIGRTAWVFSTVGLSEWCPAGNVRLDLTTGRYELVQRASRRVCGDRSIERPIKTGNIDARTLEAIRAAYLNVLSEGVKNDACRNGEPHDIIISNGGVPTLILASGNATRSTPDDWGCWTKSANALFELLDHTFAAEDYGERPVIK